jgi:hypothetical protein
MFVPQRKRLWASSVCYRDSFTHLYVVDVRSEQEIPMGLLGLLKRYLNLLYVVDVRTAQETPVGFHDLLQG